MNIPMSTFWVYRILKDQRVDKHYLKELRLNKIVFRIFNGSFDAVFREALEDTDMGVRVNGVWINNVRYADDIVLIPDNIQDLPRLVNDESIVDQQA